MVRFAKGIVFCTAILASSLIARADDMIANPAYESWAKTKAGSVVKYSQASEAMGSKSSGEMTQTLTEITPDAAKVEVKMTMTVAGNKMDMPASTLTIAAKIAKPASDAAAKMPKVEEAKDKEDVKVGDKTYSCKVSTVTSESNGMKTSAKTWTCTDVPGGLVKTQTSTTGAMTATSMMTLTSFEAK